MDDNQSSERQRYLDQRKSWLIRFIAKPLFIRANQLNIAYFAKLFPRWNTQVSRSNAHNTKIHLERWQRQDLLVCAGLARILIYRFLKLGNHKYRNQFINPNILVRAILSRYRTDIEETNLTRVVTKTEHSEWLSSIAFHPNMPFLATGSFDHTVKLWRFLPDNLMMTCVATLEGHTQGVLSLAFHPTAPLLATGSDDKTVRLWVLSCDNSSATCVATLKGHIVSVRSVAFHPTAPLLATGSDDKTVRLWLLSCDNSSATCVATLAGHSSSFQSVAFHPTAPLLATGSDDHTVKMWR